MIKTYRCNGVEMMKTLEVIGCEPKVLEILGVNPDLPYSTVAVKVGVSRERVRQIARRNGYPSRSIIRKISRAKSCPVCGETFYTRKLHCSRACASKSRQKRIVVNCHQCGKPIKRTPGSMRSESGRYYCNRVCLWRWIGKNHSINNLLEGRRKWSI